MWQHVSKMKTVLVFECVKLKSDKRRLMHLLRQGWGSCAPPSGWSWCRPPLGLGGPWRWWVCRLFLRWSPSPRAERRWRVRHWWPDRADPCCLDCRTENHKVDLILNQMWVEKETVVAAVVTRFYLLLLLLWQCEEEEGNNGKQQSVGAEKKRTGVEERRGQIELVKS